jgi:DNA ligase (NAD+)
MNKTIKKKRITIHNKTLKKKNIYKNIESNISLNKIELNKPFNIGNKNMILKQTYIKLLEQIAEVKMNKGEHFRARAYTKARDKLMLAPEFKTVEDIKAIKLGPSVIRKLKEFNDTGKIKFLEDAKNDPSILFTGIYGVGPKKAIELVKKYNITTIEQLRKNQNDVLNDVQKMGLKHYEDILKRIPRDEVIQYETKLKRIFDQVKTENSIMDIVGSYRRGATNSGDIDIIICDPKNDVSLFHNFLDKLIENGIIIEVLSRGNVKSLCISKIRGKPARRIDFMFTPRSEYSYAMLYFTGNKEFNTVMRSRALKLGYSMNEHGMYKMVDGTKTTKLKTFMPEEKDVFNFLGMEYKAPHERTGANAVVLKKRTVPKQKNKKFDILQYFIKNGPYVLSEQQVSNLLILADKAYYGEGNGNTPIMNDAQYDMLKEHAEENFPECEALKNVAHTTIEVQKNKVKLPYEMWSLDKEKTVKGVTRRISKFPGNYVISAKADGISVLYDMENQKLYSRGNGTYGQDLSFMIPYLGLPQFDMGLVIRGELIIKKDTFEKKYKGQFSNPRNFVAGVANAKKMNVKMVKDLDMLTYEVIRPKLKPVDQMKILSDTNIIKHVVVKHTDINTEFLSKCLLDWRENYPWEIDGVVVCQDELHKRVSGNPKHAFAFKMVLSDQIVEARVVDVIWEPSQQGYVKPKIRIKPVEIGGAKIEYATGHNAAFIFNNKINVGSIIQLIRSGDVIPKVHKVIAPSEQGKAPPSDMETVWNSTKIDLVLKNKTNNSIVLMKRIAAFFEKIGVVGLGRGNIQRIIDSGFDTIPKIVSMSVDDFLKVEGFKEKLSNKIYNNIRSSIENVSLEALMAGTNIFGRGLGAKKIKGVLTNYPDILWSEESQEEKLKKVADLSGFQAKTAAAFVPHIPEFMEFIEKIGMTDKIKQKIPHKQTGNTNHPLYKKKIVFTGIRDNTLQQALEKIGVIISGSVSKNTDYVIVKSLTDDTGKAEKARELGLTLMTPELFKNKFTDLV